MAFFLLALAAVQASPSLAEDKRALEFDFYRALPSEGIGAWPIQNFDLASLAGVTKYVHTEVIAEHIIGNPERLKRKYDIDSVLRLRFKVKNPARVLDPESMFATQVDFGPFVTYDRGAATNPQTQHWIQKYGGFVGAQSQRDVRWPYAEPYFWFSATGWCPNLEYDKVPMTREAAMAEQSRRSQVCSRQQSDSACLEHSEECVFENSRCIARDPAPQCLNYTADSGIHGHVSGGLCPGGAGNSTVEPTGDPDCTYSYSNAKYVKLDSLVGILDEDCGDRKCTDWLDFRMHCTNVAYRKKFDVAKRRAVPFKYCVEYDIHPDCEADCSSAACQKIPESERDIGLPYWKGKCSAVANEERTEALGSALGLATVHTQQDSVANINAEQTCIVENQLSCVPAPGQGGNYCTRQWGGVCANCFVPGTRRSWPATDMPYCPYNILDMPDYREKFEAPLCKSARPRDLCCLYAGSCNIHAASVDDAPLDDDGFALVASWGNTSVMQIFLERAAANHLLLLPSGDMRQFASRQWSSNPRKGASLHKALQDMLQAGIAVRTETETKTMTTTSVTVTSTQTATTTTSASAVVIAGQGGNLVAMNHFMEMAFALGGLLVACLVVAPAAMYVRKRLNGFGKPGPDSCEKNKVPDTRQEPPLDTDLEAPDSVRVIDSVCSPDRCKKTETVVPVAVDSLPANGGKEFDVVTSDIRSLRGIGGTADSAASSEVSFETSCYSEMASESGCSEMVAASGAKKKKGSSVGGSSDRGRTISTCTGQPPSEPESVGYVEV